MDQGSRHFRRLTGASWPKTCILREVSCVSDTASGRGSGCAASVSCSLPGLIASVYRAASRGPAHGRLLLPRAHRRFLCARHGRVTRKERPSSWMRAIPSASNKGTLKGRGTSPRKKQGALSMRSASLLRPASCVIVYCDGAACTLGPALAQALRQRGVPSVQVITDGWRQWRQAGYPVEGGGR